MAVYVEVDRAANVEIRRRDMPPLDRDDGGNVVWLPLVSGEKPAFDPLTQALIVSTEINPTTVTDTWSVVPLPPPVPDYQQINEASGKAARRRAVAFALTTAEKLKRLGEI